MYSVRGKGGEQNGTICSGTYLGRKTGIFQKDYPFVCTDEKQDMNQYSVFGDYYSPIKYSYAKGTLTIHLYCEFVQYIPKGGDYERKNVYLSNDEKNLTYCKIFQEGVKERYEIAVANRGKQEYEF